MPATARSAPSRSAPSRSAPSRSAPARSATRTNAVVALHTLGECRVTITRDDDVTTLTPASDRLFTLALLLAAEPGRPLTRARAAAWLWPDLPPTAARHALRQLVYRLRQLGVTVGGDDAHLTLAPQFVVGLVDADAPADAPPRVGRCLPDWSPPGDALAAWVDRYRATAEAAARDALARALRVDSTPNASTSHEVRVRVAAALLDLDPAHPLARAVVAPRGSARGSRGTARTLPYVGRDDVTATLHAHTVGTHAGHGSTVLITAPPGAGSTRTLHELAATARALGFTTAVAPAGDDPVTGFACALAAAVRILLDRPGALGCSPHAVRALRRFATAPQLPAGVVPLRQLGATVAELARNVAAERPVLLAVDAPCTSASDRALATTVARGIADTATLAVFVASPTPGPGEFGALTARTHVVPLRPLHDDHAARLAAAVGRAHGRTLAPDDLAWCAIMAAGRPGDVIALADACAAHPGSRTLPTPLAARLHQRLTALPQRTREVAGVNALRGGHASADDIAHALDRRRAAVDAALGEIHRAGLPCLTPPDDARPPRRQAAHAVSAAALATLGPGELARLRARAAAR